MAKKATKAADTVKASTEKTEEKAEVKTETKTEVKKKKSEVVGSLAVEWMPSKSGIAQIYSNGLEFSFLSPDNKQCAPFIFCKDFLHDVVYGFLHGTSTSIYGFTYNPSNCPPMTMDKARVLLTNISDGAKFAGRIKPCLDFMNQIEKHLHLKRSKAFICENPPSQYAKCGVYLLEGSSRWLEAPPMVSLYSLMIRVGFVHTKGKPFTDTIEAVRSGKVKPYQTNDASYLNQAKEGIDTILKLGYRKVFYKDPKRNYPSKDVSTLHNSCGIVSFAQGRTKSTVPYWHRKKLDRLKKELAKQAATETEVK